MNFSWSPLLPVLSFTTVFFYSCITAQPITLTSLTPIDATHFQAILSVDVATNDALYADYFSFSTDHPTVTIPTWHSSREPFNKYDIAFKATKKIFTKPFTITLSINNTDPDLIACNLYVGYYVQSKKQPEFITIPLVFHQPPAHLSASNKTNSEKLTVTPTLKKSSSIVTTASLSDTLGAFLHTTDSLGIRLLLAMLLGFLLSLTPCIYPMIPITMGILQSQGSRSMQRNFLLSCTYIAGIAVTFSLLGVMAAFTGKIFGSIMNNPLVIFTIVIFLMYLAGSMLGIYELHIPRFLQSHNQSARGGSLLSVFLFGAASGTVASPCLSPGLLLLLTLVTNIGSVMLGFALLFAFGFGLGIPLLIIGTFSSSLNMLPRAGMWMIDIKQFFGFIILATCFYFLSIFIPPVFLHWMIALFIASMGIFYLKTAQTSTGLQSFIKNLIGVICITASMYAFFNAYKVSNPNNTYCEQDFWLYDTTEGFKKAKSCSKLLLIDVSAPYCSICKAIDKKLFNHHAVAKFLSTLVTLKINDIEQNESTRAIGTQLHILGVPTIILWDANHDQEIHRWGSELYDYSPDQFIKELRKYQIEHE